MAAMFLVVLLVVVGLIGLGMLGAGVFVLLQGPEGPRRSLGIVLLILGLLLVCALIVVGAAFFLYQARMY
jgi:hypothetical protein